MSGRTRRAGAADQASRDLAGASTALSVTLTACSSLLAVATIPALSLVFGAALGHPLGFDVPLPLMLVQLLLMLALPVALGMWVRFRRPALASRSQPYIRVLGFGGIAALIMLIVASDPVVFVNGLSETVPLGATFVAASFLAGWLIGAASGASPPDRFTLATEFATRNMAVATAIAVTVAGRVEFAAVRGDVFPDRDSADAVRDRRLPPVAAGPLSARMELHRAPVSTAEGAPGWQLAVPGSAAGEMTEGAVECCQGRDWS